MKKILFSLVFVICLFLLMPSVYAQNAKKYASADGKNYFWIDKDSMEEVGDVAKAVLGEYYFSIGEQIFDNATTGFFFTSVDDPVYKSDDKWWATLHFCYVMKGGLGSLGADETVIAATDAMTSIYQGRDKDKFLGLFGNDQECMTVSVQDVDPSNKVSYCKYYNDKAEKINSYASKFQNGKQAEYRNKYLKEIGELKTACSQALASASYNDACVSRCLFFGEDKVAWDSAFSLNRGDGECGFSGRLLAWIGNILNWVKFIGPVLVIIIGIVDFIRAIASSKDDEMKKAQGRFIRRLIAAALVFIIPALLVFVFEKMGFTAQGCGIIDL